MAKKMGLPLLSAPDQRTWHLINGTGHQHFSSSQLQAEAAKFLVSVAESLGARVLQAAPTPEWRHGIWESWLSLPLITYRAEVPYQEKQITKSRGYHCRALAQRFFPGERQFTEGCQVLHKGNDLIWNRHSSLRVLLGKKKKKTALLLIKSKNLNQVSSPGRTKERDY